MMHYLKCNRALQFLQIFFLVFQIFYDEDLVFDIAKTVTQHGSHFTWTKYFTLMHFTFNMDQMQSHTQMYLTFHLDQLQSKSHISQIVSQSCSCLPILNPNPRQPMLFS